MKIHEKQFPCARICWHLSPRSQDGPHRPHMALTTPKDCDFYPRAEDLPSGTLSPTRALSQSQQILQSVRSLPSTKEMRSRKRRRVLPMRIPTLRCPTQLRFSKESSWETVASFPAPWSLTASSSGAPHSRHRMGIW